jgi:hypothetical protein
MKIALRVVGVLLLMGSTWFLQGANILTAGRSPMIGDTRWEYYGGLAALIGFALLVISRNRSRADLSHAPGSGRCSLIDGKKAFDPRRPSWIPHGESALLMNVRIVSGQRPPIAGPLDAVG